MSKKGILFDFDGVVVKSMEQHFNAWQKAFAEKGVRITPDEFFILEGQGIKRISYLIGRQHGLGEQAIEEVMDRKLNYYNRIMTVEFYDHFSEALDFLKKRKIPLGVVTGGLHSRVDKIVKQYFDGIFNCLVTVEDVKRGKPFPDPFLKGARMLGLAPEVCVVVENAPMGIEGALKAGMTVVAVTTTLKPEQLKAAHFVAADFVEVRKILQRLL